MCSFGKEKGSKQIEDEGVKKRREEEEMGEERKRGEKIKKEKKDPENRREKEEKKEQKEKGEKGRSRTRKGREGLFCCRENPRKKGILEQQSQIFNQILFLIQSAEVGSYYSLLGTFLFFLVFIYFLFFIFLSPFI